MTEQTLERAVKLKCSIDEGRKIRKELKELKGRCLEYAAEEDGKRYYIEIKRIGGCLVYPDTVISMLDTEIKKATEEIESLGEELDKLH